MLDIPVVLRVTGTVLGGDSAENCGGSAVAVLVGVVVPVGERRGRAMLGSTVTSLFCVSIGLVLGRIPRFPA